MSDAPMQVECKECSYTKIIHSDDDDLPSDIIIEHGRVTGHRLTVSELKEDRDHVGP